MALLKAINLGAKRRVPMAELREIASGFGWEDVTTYLQSGNLVFSTTAEVDQSESMLEAALVERFGFEVPCLVLSADELDLVVAQCPFGLEGEADPTRVHVTFFKEGPEIADFPVLAGWSNSNPDRFALGGRVMYMHLPDGMHGSKLHPRLQKEATDPKATTRNWRTVIALQELAGR